MFWYQRISSQLPAVAAKKNKTSATVQTSVHIHTVRLRTILTLNSTQQTCYKIYQPFNLIKWNWWTIQAANVFQWPSDKLNANTNLQLLHYPCLMAGYTAVASDETHQTSFTEERYLDTIRRVCDDADLSVKRLPWHCDLRRPTCN